MQDIRARAPQVAQALQQWYAADPYARKFGLYNYANPAMAPDWGNWGSLQQIGRNVVNTVLGLSGARHRIQDIGSWWNTANAITALIGYMSVTGDHSYLEPVIENTFANAPGAYRQIKTSTFPHLPFLPKPPSYTGFINGYYDDEGWWALAWIDAYDLTGDEKYLKAASDIFTDMTGAWDDVWGGGIYWCKYNGSPDRAGVITSPRGGQVPYKNAIANELFIALAAALSLRYRRSDPAGAAAADCLQWAIRGWDWFRSSPPQGVAMMNETNLVNDSPNRHGKNDNTEKVWSYNQGVVLTGLSDLSELTGDGSYLGWAEKIADAFIKNSWYLVPRTGERAGQVPPPSQSGVINGILHEQNDCNPDGSGPCARLPGLGTTQFKGIFVRNLARLYRATKKESYAQFILANAESALSNTNEHHQFGSNWAAPPDTADFVRQSAGLDLVNAALLAAAGQSG